MTRVEIKLLLRSLRELKNAGAEAAAWEIVDETIEELSDKPKKEKPKS